MKKYFEEKCTGFDVIGSTTRHNNDSTSSTLDTVVLISYFTDIRK